MNKLLPLIVFAVCMVLEPTPVNAANTPMTASAIYVKGMVRVVSVEDKVSRPVRKGTQFAEGDKVLTARNGVVEIKFERGDIIKIDTDTELVIKSLHKDGKGSTFSIFNLSFGRVASYVTKLFTKESKFEYMTKAAIAGVAGTPPWIITYRDEVAQVDLLDKSDPLYQSFLKQTGEDPRHDKGSVVVRGFDRNRTIITLLPGTRTIVRLGKAPEPPTPITPTRRRGLSDDAKLHSVEAGEPEEATPDRPESSGDKSKDPGEKEPKMGPSGKTPMTPPDGPSARPEQPSGSITDRIVDDGLARQITIPPITAPDEAGSTESDNDQSTTEEGAVGENAQVTGEDTTTIPPATGKFKVILE